MHLTPPAPAPGRGEEPCAFCEIAQGRAPAKLVGEWEETLALVPLGPVREGHTLFIPRLHVMDALRDPVVAGVTFQRAAEWMGERYTQANILTSAGKDATQSVFHLHVHGIPREAGDDLMLPWGTTGDPHAPHWCGVAQELADQLREKGMDQ